MNRVEPAAELRDALRDEILGSFDLIRQAKIYSQTDIKLPFTRTHEETHRMIASTTTFGELQLILAFEVQRHPHASQLPWSKNARELLAATIRSSWAAHEGFATFRELAISELLGGGGSRARLEYPDARVAAFEKYRKAAEMFPEGLQHFGIILAQSIAEAAFNTPVLRLLPVEEISEQSVHDHLATMEHQPDFRLETLSRAILERGFSPGFAQDLVHTFMQTARQLGIEQTGSISDFTQDLLFLPRQEYFQFNQRWNEIGAGLFEAEFRRLGTSFVIPDADRTLEEILEYHGRAQSYFDDYGIELIGRKVADSSHEIALANEEIEYIPRRIFREKMVMPSRTDLALRELGQHQDALLLLRVDRMQNISLRRIISGDYVYSVYVTPLVQVPAASDPTDPSSSGEPIMLTPTLEQYSFVGDRNLARSIIRRSRERAVLLVLEWTYVFLADWRIPDDATALIQEAGRTPLTIVQTTSSHALQKFFGQWNQLGVERIVAVAASKVFVHFLLTLGTGLHVMVKVPRGLLAVFNYDGGGVSRMLHEAYPEHESDASEKAQAFSSPPFEHLDARTVAQLDEYGAFYTWHDFSFDAV